MRVTRRTVPILLLGLAALSGPPTPGASPEALEHLPPLVPWNGKSRELMLSADHSWVTPAERDGLKRTPRYDETFAWLRRLVDAAPELDMRSIGRSAEGRDIWMVVASRAEERTPRGLRATGKPIVLAQAGIHSGEIDGKDAGLMLLRDMTVRGTRRHLLDDVHFLFIPILSVDGHERFSRHSRMNQRGPEEMGWRTNARNLNLNRDYMKLETEEVRAVLRVINAWRPDLYLDLHVTDGADFQYDVTWGMAPDYGWSGNISRWIDGMLAPSLEQRLTEMGHVPGPFIWGINGRDLEAGCVVWMGTPRFSNAYGTARHLPTILVENHSLKPYDQRVLSNYVFLEATLALVGKEQASLRAAVAKDRASRPRRLVVSYTANTESKTETRPVKAIRSELYESEVAGGEVVRWTGEAIDKDVRFVHQNVPAVTVERPAAYLIPAGWSHIAHKLRLHGIELEKLDAPTRAEVEMLRLPEAGLAGGGSAFDQRSAIYEGRIRVDAGEPSVETHTITLPAGSFRASTDQPLGDLLIMLLEPESPDSLFQWGFFLEIFSRTEYYEPYVMEPLARAMLEADPELKQEFEQRLEADPEFAGDSRARLDWFYRRTPYYDDRYRLYPIARVP
jgi:murein tripeptide amidase MpaA